MKKYFLSIAIFMASITTYGQSKFPDLSSRGSIEQNVGFTTLKITYERPSARGRKVFGELVPFDRLWRTGAGHCTKISFNQPVLLNNQKVNSGTYAVFSIPNKDEWTIIINTDSTLYGTSKYDSKKDVIRFKVKPQKTSRFYESLSFDVDIVGNNAVIYLSWEKTQVHFALQTFTDEMVMNNITQNLLTGKSKDWNEYAGAVEYYLYNNKDLNEALLLAESAIKNDGELYSFTLKTQVLEKQKKYAEAIASAKQGLEFIKTNGARLGYSDQDSKSIEAKIKELVERAKRL